MALNIPKKTWVYVERLFLTTHKTEQFIAFLKEFDIEYDNPLYKEFSTTKKRYTFMSEEDYTFANFMQSVPTYKFLKILERIVFDENIIATVNDNWNYYGDYIKNWYPTLLELINLSEIELNQTNKKLIYTDKEYTPGSEDLIPYNFNDPFLDYIRKEINESYQRGLFLSVMFLSRKLLEVIYIRILEIVFPKIKNGTYDENNHNLWYDKHKNGYRGFGELIQNTKDNSSAFQEDKTLIEELCSLVKPFKDETNSCVHDDYKIPDSSYVQVWRVTHIINLSRKLFRKYCNP